MYLRKILQKCLETAGTLDGPKCGTTKTQNFFAKSLNMT